MKQKNVLYLLLPLLVAALFGLLNLTTVYRGWENGVFDLLLHLKPGIDQEERIVFVDIDDTAIAKVGVFPWSRDIMAEGLLLMKEFGAAYAVFDIEYTEQSPRGVNAEVLNETIPEALSREFSTINENIVALFQALAGGSISLSEAQDFVGDLTGLTDYSRQILLDQIQTISRDNDRYLGQAARIFENAFFTVNMLPEEEGLMDAELERYVLQNIALEDLTVQPGSVYQAQDLRPAILPVLTGAKGAGFPNVIVDDDGVQRRIDLITVYKDHYFPQLGFAPLLDWLGNPPIEVSKRAIRLIDAQLPDGAIKDITIPLAEDGHFLINWPKQVYTESFRHFSYWELVRHTRLERNLLHNLKIMDEAGYLSYYEGDFELMTPYRYADTMLQEMLAGGSVESISDYRQTREVFFQAVDTFLDGPAESQLNADIQRLLESEQVSETDKAVYQEIGAEVVQVFSATREVLNNLQGSRAVLREALEGSFCILGWTGTSTTDIGVTPFEEQYMNVGTHGALVNTILKESFLDDVPWWYGAVLGILFALAVSLVIKPLQPLPSILVGLGFLVVLILAPAALFLFSGIYLNMLTPILSLFFTLVAVILLKFLLLEQEKSYIRNAFSHYLSTDVISELIDDPGKLNLRGEKKYMTAMFTDVKGFSTISEKLDPTDLVKLLNAYLTDMSNIILDQRGTIDKYEGDAIISFFGAPVTYSDHATRACLSAVQMKKVERVLNEHFLAENLSPGPLHTRIGINTGEMVVGNMGTDRKMDYTIMGNSVNLAARLEGVNKQYGTWILISEDTRAGLGDAFTVRQMDRVRVVGINQPVRLFELVDERESTDLKVREVIEHFHLGQSHFEAQEWDQALRSFQEALKILPEDGPSKVFLERCRKYQRTPPADSWDGVFKLTEK